MDKTSNQPKLRFSKDPMFKRVMREEDICKEVIERILGKPIGEVDYLDSQHEEWTGVRNKEIRMDSYLVESNGRLFDVEMQVTNRSVLPMRLRGYQSILDAGFLMHGEDYDDLRESYIIFICLEDPFKCGMPIYTVERGCLERPDLEIKCRSHWIVLNASAYADLGDSLLGRLLRYIYTDKVTKGDELLERIDAEVERYNDTEWAMTMLDSMFVAEQEARIKGKRLGREEGRAEGREEGQERYAKLVELLMEAGRLDDLKAASSDSQLRDRLFAEFGI